MKAVAALVAALLLSTAMAMAPTTLTTAPYKPGIRVSPFATMPQPNYFIVTGATVSVEYGFVAGEDKLLFGYDGSFALQGIFNGSNGVLSISGTAPISEYAVAIQSVVFTTTSTNGNSRQVTFSFGQNTLFASSTQHFYQYIQQPSKSWQQAASDCSSRSYMGMQGYLATITSAREHAEVCGRSTFSAWLGAQTDSSDVWRWVTGPESTEAQGAGRAFWAGENIYQGGMPVDWLSFDQWYRFRPDGNVSFLSTLAPMYSTIAYWANKKNSDYVEGWICEFGGMDAANVSSTVWDYTGSVTLFFDCGSMSSVSDCANYAAQGCSWTNGNCIASDCTIYQMQSDCVSDRRCDWFVNGEVGVCANQPCSIYANNATCILDTNCAFKVISGSGSCQVAQCADKTTACGCASLPDCSWRGQCVNSETLSCNGQDVIYLLDGTQNMMQPFERYTCGFFGLTQAFVDGDLGLTGTTPTAPTTGKYGQRIGLIQYGGGTAVATPAAVGSGGRLTGNVQQLQSDAQWHQKSYMGSYTTRTLTAGLQRAITMFGTTGRTKVLVIISSGSIDDASTLAADETSGSLLKQLKKDTTIIGVALSPTEPLTNDANNAVQSLSLLTRNVQTATMTNFYKQVIYGLCDDQATADTIGQYRCAIYNQGDCATNAMSCMWNATMNKCAVKLTTQCVYNSQSVCLNDRTCSWDYAGKSCRSSGCLDYCTSAQCSADPTCIWDTISKGCYQSCPGQGQSTCRGVCMWNSATSTCGSSPCYSNPDEDSCIADLSNCMWNPTSPTWCVPVQCTSITDASTCNQAPNNCTWSDKVHGCFQNLCATSKKTVCNSFTSCWWNATTSTCSMTPCGVYQTEMSCNGDLSCKWNVSNAPAGCSAAPCKQYMTTQACTTDPTCYWQPFSVNGFADTCAVKTCDVNPDAASCTTMSQCVWRNGACKDSTFVQCPMIDVVFLVEATTTMGRAFGRHPNGFMGIVEAIRTWSKSAPLSPSVIQSGFRLAIVGYGAVEVPLLPQVSSGNYNFTADIETWKGVGQYLDTFTQQQVQYAIRAGSNVAITQGLDAARQLFGNSSSGREQLLLILGNSPISDATSGTVNAKINSLQNAGVQIFSSLIRRFSVITPNEQLAASFLTPLASDPVELHFAYNTIDQMLSSVLNTFCDPTTSMGLALGITKNNIVPCNWLSKPTDCQIQASCVWNGSAIPTCPQADQCPNLGCVALPAALSRFKCSQCKYEGGAFACDGSTKNPASPGLCMSASCMYLPQASCVSGTGCLWDGSAGRCIRNMCIGATPEVCNANLGCVFIDPAAPADPRKTGCVVSQCGLIRDQVDCLNYADPTTNGQPCKWDITQDPPICVEKRCQYLSQTECTTSPYTTQCTYQGKCTDLVCQYTDPLVCNEDATCFWNPFIATEFFGQCLPRGVDCVTSDWGPWSPCSASCGTSAVQYQSRTVLVFPSGGAACPTPLTRMQYCNATTIGSKWQTDCTTWCSQYRSSVTSCISDMSCAWANATCMPKPTSGCGMLDVVGCNASDMCSWDTASAFCVASVKLCSATSSASCNSQPGCLWRSGTNANTAASSIQLQAQIITPGQKPITVFGNLALQSSMIIQGASVTIENGYQVGKDVLQMMFPDPTISATFITTSGTLAMSGNATITQYANAIRSVTFSTTSLRAILRNVTWALGVNTIFSLSTGHFYTYTMLRGVSWQSALLSCQSSSYFGYQGYLATITSALENQVVSNKLSGDGWISGDDYKLGVWELSTGPEAGTVFWTGGNMVAGGFQAPGQFANWDVLSGEPMKVSTGFNNVYLNQSGYWYTKSTDMVSNGYVCEFGGLMTDSVNVNFQFGGGMVIGVGGCLPTTPCSFHATNAACTADLQCTWNNNACVVGCGAFSTPAECGSSSLCGWNTKILPPLCDVNPCLPTLGNDQCSQNPQCVWKPSSGCKFKTGCAANLDAVSCGVFSATCQWSVDQCVPQSCQGASVQSCSANPMCSFSPTIGCNTVSCRYGDQGSCQSDVQCIWSATEGSSVGFVSGGTPVTPFATGTSSPTQQTPIDGITIFISQGFQVGEDILMVDQKDNQGGTYAISWDGQNGVLTLQVTPVAGIVTAIQGFSFMKQYVKFLTSSNSQARRTLSYSLGLNTYYSQYAGTFYRYNTTQVNSLRDAVAVCNGSNYFGLRGTIAYITSQQDNLALNSLHASGWIGGVFSGSVWSWQTLRGQSTFWSGTGSFGQPMNGMYSQWSVGEPLPGSVTMVVNPSGTWKGTPQTAGAYYGVICQYNGTLNQVVSGTRSVKPVGCYTQECFGLYQSACAVNPNCVWLTTTTGGMCQTDTWCSTTTTIAGCGNKELCYWDYRYSVCRSQPPTFCSLQNSTQCTMYSQCTFNPTIVPRVNSATLGACIFAGCGGHPTSDTCTADSNCRWDQPQGQATGSCVGRVCGYVTDASCWSDPLCEWDVLAGSCKRSVCLTAAVTSCKVSPTASSDKSALCTYSNATALCRTMRCSSPDTTRCLADQMCLSLQGSCLNPGCDVIGSSLTKCNGNDMCTFTYTPGPLCIAAQCLSITDQTTCVAPVGGVPQCQWVGSCQELSFIAKSAASQRSCTQEDNSMPSWLYGLIGVIALLLVVIMWRLYLAFAKNMTFLSPAKKNIRYTHQQYAADLFEENKKGAIETNSVYTRPSLNDL